MENKLPIVYMDENGEIDRGISAVALVDSPAFLNPWLTFSAITDKKLEFSLSNITRGLITGPVLIPDFLVKRFDEETQQEYYITATKQTCEKLAFRLMEEGNHRFIKDTHDALSEKTKGVTMVEIFSRDDSRGIKSPEGFPDLPDGTVYMTCKITNPLILEKIKNKEINGFSLEGRIPLKMANIELTDKEAQAIIDSYTK